MPYSTLDGITRFVTPTTIIHSAPFTRTMLGPLVKLNFGSRMAIIKLPSDSLVLWSAIPYGPQVEQMIAQIDGDGISGAGKVKYLVIPDREHTMAALEYQEKFPDIKIIGMEGVNPEIKLFNTLHEENGNKLLNSSALSNLGFDKEFYENFELVYLPTHVNKELVLYDRNSKIMFNADLLFNIRDRSEHYSEKSGFPPNYNPNTGASYMTRYLNPDSKIGRGMFNKIVNRDSALEGLKLINNWPIEKIIMCHGEIIEKNCNSIFRQTFNL